ncbi:MutS-related protein [Flavobacterium gawalongense]|uniref:DNA mismatch repair protein n=1 Tax=Flavobacterium gawalongense TaxID=2594432 RepID=A0A553BPM3_9FLAO|nr:DNA mismatch repair protein [Flavobacterium gawalongense]TRX01582.1 DNA mismatch repair protein [Flavobacterium gawalongense]TRX06067.1 DNA mismatch repair protein [Flavobacterium gawalongense]TRX10178.1 DNA mismatch repair protein [Flavobacterium gawalongense]TRX11191.1 DNA mismatch repair protein [Flavobacterium gawalongense]TRX28840.1 DNA mismatch repair protein [Flavobacterium gawalongense]
MEVYKAKKESFLTALNKINKKYNSISFFRLLTIVFFLASIYYYIKTNGAVFIALAVFLFGLFIVLMRFHSKLVFQKQIKQALLEINENEIAYLERNKIPFENGQEFNDFHHPYVYDLDIFGAHSLFQNLNRTATFIGKKTLAKQLLTLLPNDEIVRNHKATKELAEKLDWRQEFLAFAKISQDTQLSYDTLLKWSTFNSTPLSKASIFVSYCSPILFLGLFITYLVTSNAIYASLLSYVFVFNLIILGRFMKRIQVEIANSSNIDKIINQYSLLLQKIEEESFQSEKLMDLQQKLTFKKENASIHLKQLAGLFSKMDSIGNFVTAIVFNGTFLFNLHVLKSLIQWKKDHAEVLEDWMEVIGEFEMLNSLANLSYNNPEFVYPTLNTNFEIDFSNLNHPLLNKKTRVGNSVSFHPESFMILTGSNMSGKSTFLRSLGINMVLSGMGSPVCASQANVHPLPVLVSMRLSDSLSDSESYFFAEIKRLKQIMDELENRPAFVLLDEILRGTNSDDKRNGTIEVVKKVIGKKAIGAIATHDIEVCLTTNEYPNVLTNKCFEVEIINNDLHFDYKLRDGICKNRSATFLMKKMGVI